MRPHAPLPVALLLVAAGCAGSVRTDRATTPAPPTPPASSAGFAVTGAPRAGEVTADDGVPIAYSLAGTGTPTLLFVHCWGGDRSFWQGAMDSLAATNRVVAIDLPGHGASGSSRSAWTVPAFGADVVAVLRALDLREVVLVGHSLGGAVVLDAAARAPDRVVAVVGVDTLHDVESKDGMEELLAALEQDFVPTCRTFVGSIFGSAASPELVSTVQGKLCGARPEIALPILRGLAAWDATGALEAVTIPVRAIQGDRFPTDLPGNRRHHADFDVIVLPGTGHFPQLESPEDFDRALREVLRSLRR